MPLCLKVRQFFTPLRDEGRAAVGELNDDRCFNFCGGFQGQR